MRFTLVRLGIAALMIGTLAGCGGGGGNNGGGAAAAPPVTPPAAGVPTGTAPITLTSATPAATFAALAPVVTVTSVTIAGPPVVNFTVTDAVGNAIIGFGSTSKSATATFASYPNFAFGIAKLIPSVGTTPSRWVNYIVTTVPTTTAPAVAATRPTTDNTGTLVDHGNGTYTYTFFRDIKAIAGQVSGLTMPAGSVAADLDDLTFDPALVHRATIQLSGNAPGTGNNTPNAVTDPAVPGVPMANPVNAIFDFVPATGRQQATADSGRDIVATASCNECHQNLGGFPTLATANQDSEFHGGNRNKIEYCVICHTEQRKFGRAEALTVAGGNYDSTTDPVTQDVLTVGAGTYKIHGLAVGNLKQHIHKIHMSANLTKIGYNYGGSTANLGGIAYEVACKFPQDVRNCTKCHDGSATAVNPTKQGDNWMNFPNRSACGACHDGIDFSTGLGVTLADHKAGLASTTVFPGGLAHGGGAQADDTRCALCHAPGSASLDININHIPVTPPNTSNGLFVPGADTHSNAAFIASNTSRLPAGAIKPSYVILSVSRNTSKQPVMVFKMQQNGADVPFLGTCPAAPAPAPSTPPGCSAGAAANPATGLPEMWANFMGSPSVQFVFAVPEDGITAPADFNGAASGYLRNIWNGTATGAGAGNLTGPDASGFYTVTLTGVTIPDNAVMLTGGLGYSYDVKSSLPLTQTNVAGFPTTVPPAAVLATLVATNSNRSGGLIVVATDQQRPATGTAGRRPIVDDKLCNRCHLELGPFTEDAFHAGQRNDGTTCAWCHNPNQNNSGWSGDSTYFVHAIHAAAKRTQRFTWHATSASDGFWQIGYPGILNNCETCHLPGTFDFSAAASTAALPNRLYRTVATGTTVAATFSTSPYIAQTAGTVYGVGFSFNAATGVTVPAAPTTLVNSPIAAGCFGCHDDALAMGHMRSNGGSLYAPRTAALATVEQCTLCHLAGKIEPIADVHNKFGTTGPTLH